MRTSRPGSRASRLRAAAFVLALIPALLPVTGCLITRRKLPVPKAPAVTQTVAPEDLVKKLNDRWDALKSLYAKVDVQASTMKAKEGVEKDYPAFPGIIQMRKPEMLRVYGRWPVILSPMFDMASDGKTFTLFVHPPPKSMAFQGPATLTHRSPNMIENMRPGFFLDALLVRGLAPDDEYMVTADTTTVTDVKKKRLLIFPQYVLTVMRHTPGSQKLQPIRVIRFHRDDLLPYSQDLYDEQGNLETQVTYGTYADFGGSLYPSTVTIRRPLEEFQIVLTLDSVKENVELKDDQFQIQIPPDVKIQTLQ